MGLAGSDACCCSPEEKTVFSRNALGFPGEMTFEDCNTRLGTGS